MWRAINAIISHEDSILTVHCSQLYESPVLISSCMMIPWMSVNTSLFQQYGGVRSQVPLNPPFCVGILHHKPTSFGIPHLWTPPIYSIYIYICIFIYTYNILHIMYVRVYSNHQKDRNLDPTGMMKHAGCYITHWGFLKCGIPNHHGFQYQNRLILDDCGTPILGNLHTYMYVFTHK